MRSQQQSDGWVVAFSTRRGRKSRCHFFMMIFMLASSLFLSTVQRGQAVHGKRGLHNCISSSEGRLNAARE